MNPDRPKYALRWSAPADFTDLAGLEGWLAECSEQGLHFVRYTVLPFVSFWRFVRGTPRSVRYRLEPVQGKEDRKPDPERVDYYQTCGWAYRGTVGELYHVYAAEDPDAPELHTDPVSQSYTLEALERRLWRSLLLDAAMFALLLAIFIGCTLAIPGVFTGIITGERNFHFFYLTVLGPASLLYALVTYFQIRQLRKQLKEGFPMKHGDAHTAETTVPLRRSLILLLLIIAFFYNSSEPHARSGWAPDNLPERWNVPLLSLEPPDDPTWSPGFVFRDTSLFSCSYGVSQTGRLPDLSALGNFELQYTCCKVRLPVLAPLLWEDVSRTCRDRLGADALTELTYPGFERAVLCRSSEPDIQVLLLAQEDWLICVEYCSLDLERYGERLFQQLQWP